VKEGPLQFTLRRLQGPVFSPRFWAVMLVVAVILGLAGPFGTFGQLPLVPRLGYWLALAFLTFLAGYATIGLALRYMPGPVRSRPARIAFAGLAAGVPVTVVVVALNYVLFGEATGSAAELLDLYINCSLIAAAISFLFGLLDSAETGRAPDTGEGPATIAGGSSGAGAKTEKASSSPDAPPLFGRLPRRLRGRLLYLSMQDHYVDVHTDRGAALVLMRLADAIRETGDVAGLHIHRSHWVALEAVEGVKRRDGKLFLEMADGALLPVSRGARGRVKAAGIA
jgi:DNA-binding LytR/AlgR family response regulator